MVSIEIEEPKLLIPLKSWQRLMSFVELCPIEISGFADVEYDKKEKVYRVGEVYLLTQEASAAEVEMSEEDVSTFMLERIKQGATQMPRLWWHSHVNMGAFFSGVDDTAMEELKNDSFFVGLVVNKSGEYKAIIKYCDPFEFYIKEVNIAIDYTKPSIPNVIKDEYQKKVKLPEYEKEGKEGNGESHGKQIYVNGHQKDIFTKGQALTLPVSFDKAYKRVKDLGLKRMWDEDSLEWYYYDFKNGNRWIDSEGLLLMDESIPEISRND